MSSLIKAHNFVANSPREALWDAVGLGAFAVMVFGGLLLPAIV